MTVHVSSMHFTPAKPKLAGTGLLGWVTCTVNSTFQLGGIALRRTLDGRIVLSFPERICFGRRHRYVRLLADDDRQNLEEQILAELRRQGRLAS